MEKRVFLAVFLMFVVLVGYDYFIVPKLQGPKPEPPAATEPAASPAAPAAPAPAAPAPTAPAAAPAQAAATPIIADTEAREIIVETDAVRAVFSSAGATLSSWRLKRYMDAEGDPFDVVPPDVPAALPRAFTITTDDPAMSATLASAIYRPSSTGLSLGSAPGSLTFEYRDSSGLNARKTFHFQPDGKPYILNVTATVDVNGASRPVTLQFGPALGPGTPPAGWQAAEARGLLFRNDAVERLAASDLQEKPTYEGQFRYAGVESHYFLSVVLPGMQSARLDYQPVSLPGGPDPSTPRKYVGFSVKLPAEATVPFLLGPKDFDVLRDVDPQLVRAIDFGFFAWLVVPLLQALKWINGYLHNYGWSIIVLTILINLLIFPLRHRSMVSMRKMQAAQGEIKAIQERYAKYKWSDPERQKMNSEMMALYKQRGINPASGCLPMLMTFPILFAFYQMLSMAIELRGAPFMFWLRDLSVQDPYWITPLLMGASMFWQQKMTPMPSTDPVQQKIFLFLPVFFTVTFLWAPAGLVLYWLMSNLMGILQQTITLRMIGAPPAPRPAVARAVKPVKPAPAASNPRNK